MNEKIKTLLLAAIAAPSGENCQPWRFGVKDNTINIFNDPESDQSLYNFKQHGSLISHGAAIENILITASTLGLNPEIKYLPDPENQNLVASIRFTEKAAEPNPLASYIPQRTTNRKKYNKIQISDAQLRELKSSVTEIGTGEIKFITDESKINSIAHSLSINEKIIFENKYLHNFFYNHIRWTKEEDKANSTGFYIETLELNSKQRKGFTMFKKWPVLKIFNTLVGASKLVAKDNEDNYRSASTIGIITFKTNTDGDYVQAGRVMQRLWLKVTKIGLSLQPATGVLFLTQRILAGNKEHFTEAQLSMLETAYGDIVKMFEVSAGTIMMLFRIGDGGMPSARASRQDINYFLKN